MQRNAHSFTAAVFFIFTHKYNVQSTTLKVTYYVMFVIVKTNNTRT